MQNNIEKYDMDDYSMDDLVGAVIGQVTKEEGNRIPLSKVNRYLKALNMKPLKRKELEKYLDRITVAEKAEDSPDKGYQLFEAVKSGHVKLFDLFGSSTTDESKFNTYLENRIPATVTNNLLIRKQQREFKALQRDGGYLQLLLDDVNTQLSNDIKNNKVDPLTARKVKRPQGKNAPTLLINASDWHIGNQFKVNAPGIHNEYNFDIFKKRWYEFLDDTLRVAKDRRVKDVYLIHLGDIVEGAYMRPNQGFYTEFTFSEQIVKATEMMIDTIKTIVNAGYPVHVGMIIGNHDRIFTKKDNLYGDGVTQIILRYIKLLIDNKILTRVDLIDNGEDIHDINIDIVGNNCLFTHGEKVKMSSNDNISNLTGKDKPIDYLFYGHYHNFQVKSGNGGTLEVCVPANKGWDTYSKSLGANNASAGQLNVLFYPNKTPEILPYFFN